MKRQRRCNLYLGVQISLVMSFGHFIFSTPKNGFQFKNILDRLTPLNNKEMVNALLFKEDFKVREGNFPGKIEEKNSDNIFEKNLKKQKNEIFQRCGPF